MHKTRNSSIDTIINYKYLDTLYQMQKLKENKIK